MPSPPRSRRLLPTVDPQQPVFDRHLRKFLHLPSRTNTAPPVRPRDPLDFSATSALPPNPSPLAQATTRFDGTSPPRRSNGLTQLLRQHLSLHRSSHQPPAVEVAAGRKFTRLAAANLPEYRKVDDTRHPSRRHPSTGNDPPSESSDIDSLPDVHWCKAFFCYYSCWSHRRLRIPPRWRLERVYPLRQAGTTSSSAGGVHSGS
ncbi:hypothetical protein DFH29DRAFT_940149 [Suillus ampliporus]|nr:hypothetical protein DFH29DRAFT_940149 [Suillus ampliporus]